MKSIQSPKSQEFLSYSNRANKDAISPQQQYDTLFQGENHSVHCSYGSQGAAVRGNTYSGGGTHAQSSLSGSETELSTSNENLTHEERYVLRNSTRQEPQGEETLEVECSGSNSRFGGRHSNYASMDQSSCNTLIIHRDTDTDFDDEDEEDEYEEHGAKKDSVQTSHSVPAARLMGRPEASQFVMNEYHENHDAAIQCRQISGSMSIYYSSAAQQQQQQQQQSLQSYRQSPGLPQQQPSLLAGHDNYMPRQYLDKTQLLKLMAKEAHSLTTVQQVPSNVVSSAPYPGAALPGLRGDVSAYDNSQVDFDLSKLPPPPEYPKWLQTELSASQQVASNRETCATVSGITRTTDTAVSRNAATFTVGAMSRSQPDLSCLGRWDDVSGGFRRNHYLSHRPRTKGKASPDVSPAVLHQRVCDVRYHAQGDFDFRDPKTDKLLEILMAENRQLKCELESSYYKVFKLQKFEVEIQKVHQAHEELVKSSQKREELEHKVKMKLQWEMKRYQELNKELKAQLDVANSQLAIYQSFGAGVEGIESKRDVLHRDVFVTQLIQQNKELIAAKERYEIELAAQRATLQEQRTHIDILDSALTNAQANVVKLEEECRKKQTYVDRVGQLQKALTSLQVASERRDQMARTLRCQLEKELQELKHPQQQKNNQPSSATGRSRARKQGASPDAPNYNNHGQGGSATPSNDSDGEARTDAADDIDNLKRIAREKEERIIALETEVSKWEQRYLEENTMRQIAIDAASMPKDAKIAALERTSQESEKLIAQARSEKLRHMDELHLANKQCADLDARVKDLESGLAERDAMIKVLQKHSMEKDAAYQSAMMRSPRHTPHPSFHAATSSVSTSGVNTSSATSRGNSLSRATSSSPQLACSPEIMPSPSLLVGSSEISDVSVSKESLDEQLKKLDSQLLSKDSIIQALRSEKEKYPSHYWMV